MTDSRMKILRVLGLLLALALGLAVTVPSMAKGPKAKPRKNHPSANLCTDNIDAAIEFEITVAGEPAKGRYALPFEPPSGLVVFAHGYGHTSASWADHLKRVSAQLNVISVAMDYRGIEILKDTEGDGVPPSRGWN